MSKKTGALALGAVLLVVAVAAAAVWLFPILKVTSFEVVGNDHVAAEEVEQASGVVKGSNLVRLDAREAAHGVASLPWVESATVSRAFPSTVQIELVEHEAVAYVREGDRTILVDNNGKEFAEDEAPPEAVELTGHTDSGSPEMQGAVDAVAALPAPMVRTISPGCAREMTSPAASEKSGSKMTGMSSGILSVIMREVIPSTGFSRAP